MSKKNGNTKSTKKLFPKTIYVENYGTKKYPSISATHDLDTIMLDYNTTANGETRSTVLARYELVEIGTLETTTKFKASE